MILIINTANTNQLEVILAKSQDDFKVKKLSGQHQQAEQLLPAINGILAGSNKSLSDISGLGVVSGPGCLPAGRQGFTALRIGVVTANTLAYALNIPIVSLTLSEFSNHQDLVKQVLNKLKKAKIGGIIIPAYGREPNIS